MDDVIGTPFRLLVSSEVSLRDVPDALRRKVIGLGGVVLSLSGTEFTQSLGPSEWAVVEVEGVLKAWLRAHGLLAALVRPDHYVFAVARQPADLNAMSALLDKHLHLIGC